jgi:hypothetical protein
MTALATALRPLGADAEAIHAFDSDGPGLLPYASMLTARSQPGSDVSYIDGVYEWQNEPLVFLVDGARLQGDQDRLNRLRRLIAMRGDAPYLGVYSGGALDVYQVSLDASTPSQARIEIGLEGIEKASTFAYLGNRRPGVAPGQRQWISQVILNLLGSSIDRLKEVSSIDDEDAISLVGRALLARFLADRQLIPKTIAPNPDASAKLFDNAAGARSTSDWLDQTFNGDFLPLGRSVFRQIPASGYKALGDILHKAPGGQLFLGWQERWDNLDFAHIPVGVLSQAYEHYLRRHAPVKQRKEGGFYTPRPIADLMVRGAFAAIGREGNVHSAKVLDPAAGAGVFLLTVFRELVAARWKYDGIRPDTKILREILYRQIVGFDINEAALRFAALGLYLITIELDPHPVPVRKLRFRNLRGNVLFKVGANEGDKLGSLGPSVGPDHAAKYDLVLGNPPWSSGTKLPGWQFIENKVAAIAAPRIPVEWGAPPLPNEGLDLPFVWRALEWAKDGGQIAFALHARLLFQQGDGMREARRALFGAVDVNGVINGSELRQTKVWPEVAAPFCLLYARNRKPAPGSAFRFVTPRLESSLNDAGTMRIDAANAGYVTSLEVIENPFILKTLTRGSDIDLEVFRRMRARKLVTLGEYWSSRFGTSRGRPNFSGNGYQRLRPSSRVRQDGDGQPGVDAGYLTGMSELTPDAVTKLLIQRQDLGVFDQKRIHDPRSVDLFRGPLLIVHKSPPAGSSRIQVAVSDHDVVFNETYYGYSGRRHLAGKHLVRYLALVLSSQVALWLALILSGEFGFEREVIEKSTIDEIALPSFDSLERADLARSDELFEFIARDPSDANWNEVNRWVASLYGFNERDLQAITDTLTYNLPFAENRNRAQLAATDSEVSRFAKVLTTELGPWARRYGREISVTVETDVRSSPWRFLKIISQSDGGKSPLSSPDWPKFIGLADELAATELVLADDNPHCLWLARLGQARYWSVTAARRVSQRLVWDHVSWLLGKAA